jgi:hypothetical protein
LIAALLGAQTAFAHHGFGNFDMNAEVEITGTVTELAFVNPHSWLYLDVVGDDGQVVPYRCEMRSATTLRRSGWSPDMFPQGEQVTITGSPDRGDPHACYVSTLIFPDGSSIDRYGQRTPPTPEVSESRPTRRPSGEPNLSGEWAAEQLVMTDPRGQAGSLVPLSEAGGQGAGGGQQSAQGGPVPLFSGEAARRLFVARIELTQAGQSAQEAMQQSVNPGLRCGPISVLVDWSYDSPVNRITQNDDTIVLEYGKFDYARTIHMGSSEHPSAIEPSLTGHSIGRWEGDVLVVDTVGFDAGPLTRVLPHSEQLHLVERFMLDEQSGALTREFTAEDPTYFAEAYTGYDTVYPSNVPYAPSPCDDRSL